MVILKKRRTPRSLMMEKRAKEVDWISDLPEPIIHHIMSFLPHKDTAKVSALSKRFRSAWNSFPFIYFDETLNLGSYGKSLYVKGKAKVDKFLNYVSSFLQHRSPNISLEKFRFCAELKGYDQQNHHIDGAISYALENHVKELELDVGQTLFPFPLAVLSAKSIRVLKLKGFRLDSGYEDLMVTHPFVESLSIQSCKGMKTLEVSCQKLKTMAISSCYGLKKIEVNESNLESFSFLGVSSSNINSDSCDINIAACKALKYLSLVATSSINIGACRSLTDLILSDARINDAWLERTVQGFPLLKNFRLSGCSSLEKFTVSNEELETLELIDCEELKEVEIYARSLDTFLYTGGSPNLPLFSIDSSCFKAKLSLNKDSQFSSDWFLELRKFLASFGHCKELQITCKSADALIVPRNLRDSLLPPLYDLKHLKLLISAPKLKKLEKLKSLVKLEKLEYLVNSLLWLAPNPYTIILASDSKEKSLKLKYEKTPAIVEDLSCCYSRPIKCWRHYLKYVTMENFGIVEEKVLQNFFVKEAMRLEET